PPPVHPIAGTFVGHINAGRYQEAYALTSQAFRATVTQKQFEEFCKRRDLPRAYPELLSPDRKRFPETQGRAGVVDTPLLPFSITVVKDEDGQWRVDEVLLHEVDDKLNPIQSPETKGTEKE